MEYILATVILVSVLMAYNFIMDTMSAPPDIVVDPTLLSLLSNKIKDLLEAQVLHGNSSSPFFSFDRYLNQELGYILKDYAYRIEVVSGGITTMLYDNTSKLLSVGVVEPGTLNLLVVGRTQTGYRIVNATTTDYSYSNGAYFYTVNVLQLGVNNPVYALAVLETSSYRYIDYLRIEDVIEVSFAEYNGMVSVAVPSNLTSSAVYNATLVYYGNMTYEMSNTSVIIETAGTQGDTVSFTNKTVSYVLINNSMVDSYFP